ncbi:unnamed protein product [Peronospora farinosa]|uniref:Uncharacterized protein n=1 Tax=Peronospora farinosa TaxID=134698 RepID=A0AAV0TGR8_9STRA|nr:unnamed protein product [Peronospora farinosa]
MMILVCGVSSTKQSLTTPASASLSRSSAKSTSQMRYRQQSQARTIIPDLKRRQVTVTATATARLSSLVWSPRSIPAPSSLRYASRFSSRTQTASLMR